MGRGALPRGRHPLGTFTCCGMWMCLGGRESGLQCIEETLRVDSVNCEWRTLAVQVATGCGCGPPRTASPIPQAHRKIACGMVGVPTLPTRPPWIRSA